MSQIKLGEVLDLKTILSGVILFLLLVFASYSLIGLKPFFVTTKEPAINVNTEELTEEKIREAKGTLSIKPDNQVVIVSQPIITPTFVTDSERLTKYLASKSQGVRVGGEFKSAYLYIKTSNIDIKNESVYFYITNGKAIGGHLVPTESLPTDSETEFLYDLSKLPTVQLPYSLKKPIDQLNVVKTILNYKPATGDRKFYVGGFVSTTRLPNQIERIEIQFTCEIQSNCFVEVLK